MTRVFIPNEANILRFNSSEKLRRLIDELRDYGIPALRLQSACLHLYPEWRDDLFGRIENEMTSSNRASMNDSLKAVLVIVERSESDANKNDFSRG